jgi:hypothetical protein
VSRLYTIWPADREGLPASSPTAWQQDRHWIVLDITDGLDSAHVVEGPVSRWEALRRELEIRTTDMAIDTSIRRKAAR